MYNYFNKHRFLRGILDWLVIIGVVITISSLFGELDFKIGWFVPTYINVFVIAMFCYIDLIHEPSSNRMDLVQWMDNIRWINGCGLVLHTTIGYYSKSYEKVVDSVWNSEPEMIILTISIYLALIIVPSIVIWYKKRTLS